MDILKPYVATYNGLLHINLMINYTIIPNTPLHIHSYTYVYSADSSNYNIIILYNFLNLLSTYIYSYEYARMY